MKRCLHLNCEIHQYTQGFFEWQFTGGEITRDRIEPGGINLSLSVSCPDCGFQHYYSAYSHLPDWLEERMDKIYQAAHEREMRRHQ